ncbi:MAG: hypothetical protein V1754_06260, partial [Pseudomonadota bacterium]
MSPPCYKTVVGIIFWAIGIPGNAPAQTRLQGQIAVSSGFTDNIDSRPRTPPPGEPGSESDGFADISPGLRFFYGSPRFLQQLDYTFYLNLYFQHSEAISYSNRLEWLGLVQSSQSTRLTLGAGLEHGRQNVINLQQSASATTVGAQAEGNTTSINPTVNEILEWDVAQRWRILQTLLFFGFLPVASDRPQAPGIESEFHLVASRNWANDDISVDFGTRYSANIAYYNETGEIQPFEHQLIYSLVGSWEHAFGPEWTTELRLGVLLALDGDSFSGVFEPTGGVS